jgi:iron complex outermembrane receptor protein
MRDASRRSIRPAIGTALAALCLAQGATAQSAPPAAPEAASPDQAPEEIVVTGTLIRGIKKPVGAQTIDVSKAEVAAIGAVSTDQLLANIPQVSNFFNTLPAIGSGTGNQIQVNRPNLRNLPGGNAASGAATLILVDGHRVVGAGVLQSAVDPDIVPPGAIERVEIVTDGGSSTYGADAIGGVINFITKSHVEGVQTEQRYGFADGYSSIDVTGTVGHDWGTGSAFVSYDYTTHDALYGRDRDYVKSIDWRTGIPTGRQCPLSNIAIGSTFYAAPAFLPGTANVCDLGKNGTIYPWEERHSVFAGLTQDVNDWIKFDLRGFYTERKDIANQGPGTATVNVSPSNPFYRDMPGASGATQTAEFDLSPISGNALLVQTNKFDEWGITPTVTADLGGDWELRGMFNYGQSDTSYFLHGLNQTLLTQYANNSTISTAINPYDIAATPNKNLINNIQNWSDAGEGDATLTDVRVIGDGSLFSLPGGTVHGAAGIEYLRDSFSSRSGQFPIGQLSSLPFNSYTRDDKSAFAEVQIPVFGGDFTFPGVNSLSISASGRYDYYSDFGHTANPRIGVTYKPVDWINLRGNWGTSFNAPTAVDQLGALNTTVLAENFFVIDPPGGVPHQPGDYAIALQGSRANLRPQTADTRSFGFDIDPPFVPGLTASASYYYIDFFGVLGSAPVFNPPVFFANFPGFYILNPTKAQIAAFAAQAPGGLAQVQPFLAPNGPHVYELLDYRKTNLGDAKISGIDWSLRYSHDTDFGSVDATISGNNLLKDYQDSGPGTVWANQIATGNSLFRFALTVGANIGDLRAQLTVNHSQGYNVVEAANLPQTHVDSFDIVNLFFRYDLDDSGLPWTKKMSVTLNIGNVFDTDPPVYKLAGAAPGGIGGGFANGQTLGRLFQFGIAKDF